MMKKKNLLALLAAGGALALGLSGCTGGTDGSASGAPAAEDSGLSFAIVVGNDPADPFASVIKTGAEAAAKQLGVELSFQGSSDAQTQIQQIEAAVNSGVDGIGVSYFDPSIGAAVKKAVDAGIPVYGLNGGLEDVEKTGVLGFVGQDDYIAGQAVGTALKDAGLTKALCVNHYPGATVLEARCNGIRDTFGGEVTNLNVSTTDLSSDQSSIKSALAADPSYDAVVTLGFAVAGVAIPAISEAGSNATLATFDMSPEVLQSVKDGDILFAVDQQPYLQGYLPVQFLYLYNTNGNIVGAGLPTLTGPNLVTQDNVDSIIQFGEGGTR